MKQALEAKLGEWLAQYLERDLIHEAMLEVPELVDMRDELFEQLLNAFVVQSKRGGIQVTVKLPSVKAMAKQRRARKAAGE